MDLDARDVARLKQAVSKPGSSHSSAGNAPSVAPEREPGTILLVTAIALVIIGVIAVLMVRSAWVTPVTPADPDVLIYNEFEFVKQSDGFWKFNWTNNGNVYGVPLRYNPTQVENVTVTGRINPQFGADGEVYVAIDPSMEANQQYVGLGAAELSISLMRVFGVKLIAACTVNETESCNIRPIRNCSDIRDSVIIVREGQGPSVTFDNKCVTIQGKELDIVRAVDRLLYRLYNVMD